MPFVLLIMAVFALLSNQPLLITCSLLSYIFVIRLFWKDGEPKVIVFGLTLFWLSVTVKLFYAIFVGVDYESLSNAPNIVETTYTALLAFICFSLGLYATTKKIREKAVVNFNNTYNYNVKRVLIVYAGSIVAVSILKGFIFFVKGLDQIVYALIDLKAGFIFIALYFTFTRRDSVPFVIALITVEIILSFFSYFSTFKDVLFTILIVLLTNKIKLSFRNIAAYTVVGGITLYLLFTWQSIKSDYRTFLNKGTRSQTIQVSQGEALDKLQELALEKRSKTDDDDKTMYASVDRLSYIEFYSESRIKVPALVPYENGRLWMNNIAHVLLPRILFPGKPIIDDSEMVNKYCIRKVATGKMGASWSLGMVAESYIDFGPVIMYIPIFLLGCLIGFFYSLILKQSINYFWGYAMVLSLYTKIACNGTPGSKVLGWIITYYVAFLIFRKFLMKPLDNYLRKGTFT